MSQIKLFFSLAVLVLLSAATPETVAPAHKLERCSDLDVAYTVEESETLLEISKKFGSTHFWESLYIANFGVVDKTELIHPGQTISVPYNVAGFIDKDISLESVIENPFCRISEPSYRQVVEKYLIQYADSFLETVKNTVREPQALKETEEEKRQIMNKIYSLVQDDTRSKVGRDFYDAFYSYWKPSPNAQNYIIHVSEQLESNFGTTVYVTVDNTETFRMRLKPYHGMIQEAGKNAARQTNAYLNNKSLETLSMNND